MSKIDIMRWKDSAGMSWINNERSVAETGYFTFEITVEQKEYLEVHINKVDGWCEHTIGETPVAIKFEPFWNGMEDVFTCDCYFEKWYNR